MTVDHKSLNAFFGNVVDAFITTPEHFHWPRTECFTGECKHGEVSTRLRSPEARLCNWKGILILAAWFLKHGPDVDDDWNGIAWEWGCDPERLHDVFLGIFIGGDGRTSPGYSVGRITDVDPDKALQEFRLQVAKDLEPKETP